MGARERRCRLRGKIGSGRYRQRRGERGEAAGRPEGLGLGLFAVQCRCSSNISLEGRPGLGPAAGSAPVARRSPRGVLAYQKCNKWSQWITAALKGDKAESCGNAGVTWRAVIPVSRSEGLMAVHTCCTSSFWLIVTVARQMFNICIFKISTGVIYICLNRLASHFYQRIIIQVLTSHHDVLISSYFCRIPSQCNSCTENMSECLD